ncbi:GNAT family N-acetyltransferase [Streptomyces millisiae]|uniref:GNAT family N-acetyltransferase n=1 Tax=Streptomyces millisiae TaxID=3075542 RepID=A0ABU2LT70_9ACTN|nr:GNAT family N-acetyltransferase [Streptomyces sp. DSM 44918]MDT0320720.1 GNAT family N-acetyltransferase [Streptomyces sp. DSM 44918]
MTTTLRPSGPEESTPEGGRARGYEIRVNARRVGELRLESDPRVGVGRVTRLTVDEADRRRGRATVAMLAAEEVLRAWDCASVEAAVPAEERALAALADALGYRERSRNMAKTLADRPPALPPGSTARAMTEQEYPAWLAHDRDGVTRALVERGVPEAVAAASAERSLATLLPEGPATKDAVLRVLTHDGADVGTLWVAVPGGRVADELGLDAWVFSVEVAEAHRGRGHGRSLMLEAERVAAAAGARLLGLNVYAGNTPALRLYESLGYRTLRRHLYKPLR